MAVHHQFFGGTPFSNTATAIAFHQVHNWGLFFGPLGQNEPEGFGRQRAKMAWVWFHYGRFSPLILGKLGRKRPPPERFLVGKIGWRL
jgi:hypothetical protein